MFDKNAIYQIKNKINGHNFLIIKIKRLSMLKKELQLLNIMEL